MGLANEYAVPLHAMIRKESEFRQKTVQTQRRSNGS